MAHEMTGEQIRRFADSLVAGLGRRAEQYRREQGTQLDTATIRYESAAHPTAGERLSASFVRVMDRVVAEARADLIARGVRRPDGSLYSEKRNAAE